MTLKEYVSKITVSVLNKLQTQYQLLEVWADKKLEDDVAVVKSANYYFNLGWWILKIGLGIFLLWAFLAPLDRGVTASGSIISDGSRKVVQSQNPGVIDQIFVREDENVEQGQLLVKLNDVAAQAGTNTSQETISGIEAQIQSAQSSLSFKQNQIAALKTQLSNARAMAQEGYMPKNRVLEIEQSVHSLQSSIAQEQANLENLKRVKSEELQKQVVREQDLKWTEIRSPVAGTVVDLQVFTTGGYVPAGGRLMDISPRDAGLIAEAELPVNLIDKVSEGMPVVMLFSAFNQNKTPKIPGVLTLIGEDRLTDRETRKPYYKIQAQVTTEGREMLGELKIKAGMPVDLFIKTGERTFVSYLLKPIIDRLGASLREH